MGRLPPIVAFAAPSGTGKTTLIEGVIRVLVGRGLRVGVLKTDAHRVVLDTPGKDSWRFSEAGAVAVAVVSSARLALFKQIEGDVTLVSAVDRLMPQVDIVLAEGFRRSGIPTIRVHRSGGPGFSGWDPPRHVMAWASDVPLPDEDAPVLPLDAPEKVADWLVAQFVAPRESRRVTVVCPARTREETTEATSVARRIAALLDGRAMVVHGRGVGRTAEAGVTFVQDIRPRIGLLGALFTGLAAADTPDVLFVGPRHWNAPDRLLRKIVQAGPPLADVVYPRVDGRPEPALALYGHRCLSNIQAALLSDELQLIGWWGQVRTFGIEESVWRSWDVERRAFPSEPARTDGNSRNRLALADAKV